MHSWTFERDGDKKDVSTANTPGQVSSTQTPDHHSAQGTPVGGTPGLGTPGLHNGTPGVHQGTPGIHHSSMSTPGINTGMTPVMVHSAQHTPTMAHHTPNVVPGQGMSTALGFTDPEQMFFNQLEHNLYQHEEGPIQENENLSNSSANTMTSSVISSKTPATSTTTHKGRSGPNSKHSSRAASSQPEYYISSNSTPDHPQYYQPQQPKERVPEYEFQLDNLLFMDGLNFEGLHVDQLALGSNSLAYPPVGHQDQTPLLLAMNKKIADEKMFALPILPGQNEKLFNNQHYYHKHKEYTPTSAPQSHVRPDAVFTPLVSPAVTPLESQVNANRSYQQPVAVKFEPLTSPALAVQTGQKPSNDRRRSSSSVYGPGDETYTSATYNKRRTPHGTPVLSANGSKSKQSPSLKVRDKSDLAEMLPPSQKKVQSYENLATGTPLMGFTMGRLAEQKSEDDNPSLSRRSSYRDDGSSLETLPVLESQKGRKGEKPTTKKASHKLAEQERRNRMNVAVQELGGLVPKHYHDEVSIPLKATTVELASRYIRDLLDELETLRK